MNDGESLPKVAKTETIEDHRPSQVVFEADPVISVGSIGDGGRTVVNDDVSGEYFTEVISGYAV